MYKVKTNNKASKKITNKVDFVNLDGFLMPSKKQYFIINSERIKDIKVVDNELIKAMVSKKVKAKYKRLIAKITELFLDEDGDEAGNMSEVLNRIEKKYRDQTGEFIVEGSHLVLEAYRAGLIKECKLYVNKKISPIN